MKFSTIISSLFGTYEDIPAVVVNDEGQGLIRGPPTSGVVVNEQKRLTSKQKGVLVGGILLFATVALKMGGRGEGEGGRTPADPTVDFLHISEKNNCDINTNAHMYDTDVSKKMNNAIDGDVDDGYYGIIARNKYDGDKPKGSGRYGRLFECGGNQGPGGSELCGVCGTYWHNDIVTPNQSWNFDFDDVWEISKEAGVMIAFIDAWSMNGGTLQGYAYYPTDANSNDGRAWQDTTGIPGRGCHHSDQNYVYNKDSSKISGLGYASLDGADNDYCKCNYNAYDQTQWGNLVYESTTDKNNPNHEGFDNKNGVNWNQKQPAFVAHDASSCWVEEYDLKLAQNMRLITDAQNSLYHTRGTWWNGGNQNSDHGDKGTYSYPGYNEVSMSADMDDINKYVPDALVIVLPTGLDDICYLDNNGLAQSIDTKLYTYWSDPDGGYGNVPVVTMKTYDTGNEDFQTYFIAQEFVFESRNCIKIPPGGSEAYYYADESAKGVCY